MQMTRIAVAILLAGGFALTLAAPATAHKAELNLERLVAHFHAMIGYDVAEDRLRPNIDHFLELLLEGEQND